MKYKDWIKSKASLPGASIDQKTREHLYVLSGEENKFRQKMFARLVSAYHDHQLSKTGKKLIEDKIKLFFPDKYKDLINNREIKALVRKSLGSNL
jgi:hypothetical protein